DPVRVEVGALPLAGVGRVGHGKDVIRESAGEGCDASQLPAFEDPAGEAVRQMSTTTAERQVARVIENQPVPHVEVRIAALGSEIEGVSWELLVAGCRDQWVGRVVNRVCPGVCRLNSQPFGKSPRNVYLEGVIDRRRSVVKEFCAQEGIIVDCIKGQYARLGA